MGSVFFVVGEQPPSSMTPLVLETKSGKILVIGGSGGSMITTGVALVSRNKRTLFAFLSSLVFAYVVLFLFLVFNKSPVAGHESERRHCCSYSLCWLQEQCEFWAWFWQGEVITFSSSLCINGIQFTKPWPSSWWIACLFILVDSVGDYQS